MAVVRGMEVPAVRGEAATGAMARGMAATGMEPPAVVAAPRGRLSSRYDKEGRVEV